MGLDQPASTLGFRYISPRAGIAGRMKISPQGPVALDANGRLKDGPAPHLLVEPVHHMHDSAIFGRR